jgi:carboxylate-amine ligase
MPFVTLGLEEELQVVCPETLLPQNQSFLAALQQDPRLKWGASSECHKFIVEVQTAVCSSAQEVLEQLWQTRTLAAHHAKEAGQSLVPLSLHPVAHWARLSRNDDSADYPHYAHLFDEHQELMKSLVVCGTHIHLGVPKLAWRVPLMNALRQVLPPLFALSVGSPFFEGRDTGLASWRHAILDRLPRMGIPSEFASEESYWQHVARLRTTRCLKHAQNLWGDVRLHHAYPTVEVRIFDVMPRLARNELVVLFLHVFAEDFVRRHLQGERAVPWARELIEENKWRARRWGQRGLLVDWDADQEEAVFECLYRLLERVETTARELGQYLRLRVLLEQAFDQGDMAAEMRQAQADTPQWERGVKIAQEALAC